MPPAAPQATKQQYIWEHADQLTDANIDEALAQGFQLPPEVLARRKGLKTLPPSTEAPTPPPPAPSTPAPAPVSLSATNKLALRMPPEARERVAWLPGMEWSQLLPAEKQEKALLQTEDLLKLAAGLGINLAGTFAGGLLGAATGPFAPVAMPLGAAVGSYGARRANVALGLEEPGSLGDVLSLAPAVGAVRPRGAGAVLRYTTRAGRAERAAEQQAAEYATKVAGQAEAVTTARAVPGAFAPPVPARQLYADFATAHAGKVVDVSPASTQAAEVYLQIGPLFPAAPPPTLAVGRARGIPPQRLDVLANEIARLPATTTVDTIHEYMKVVGPLTRNRNPMVRGAAKQLYSGLQDALDTVPGVSAALAPARAAARREFATQDLGRVVRQAISVGNDGHPRLDAGKLLTWHERLSDVTTLSPQEQLLRGSFSPSEWTQLGRRLETLAGHPPIPGVGTSGAPPFLPQMAPFNWRRFEAETLGGLGGFAAGVPIVRELGTGLALYDALDYGLSKLLLMPQADPLIRKLMLPGGRIDPRALALFNAAFQQERAQASALPTGPEMPSFVLPPFLQNLLAPQRQPTPPQGQ